MKYAEVLKIPCIQYFKQNELPAACIFGLPYASWEDGAVTLTFFPHRMRLEEGRIAMYEPEYKLTVRAPFRHVENFMRLRRLKEPLDCQYLPIRDGEAGKAALLELCAVLDTLLDSCFSDEEKQRETAIYQEKWKKTIEMLGLQEFYRGMIV